MTDEKLLEVIGLYETKVTEITTFDWKSVLNSTDDYDRLVHLLGMLPQMRGFVAEGRREKAMRWLGFVQGVLWTTGAYSIAGLKAHNAPPEAT